MDKLLDVTTPAVEKFRQLQKIIQDIKKSDGTLLDKLRRLKSKPPPKLPARDYRDADQLPNSDHHGGLYEEEQEDQYEPPPCPTVPPSVSTPASFSREEYLDNRRTFPLRPPLKPVCSARNFPRASDDEDYIDLDESNNEDNYVEPAEDPAKCSADAPRSERRPLSLPARLHPGGHQASPPTPSPRLNMRRSPTWVAASTSEDGYEVCDPGGGGGNLAAAHPGHPPKLLPRERSPRPALKPKPDLKSRECEADRSSAAGPEKGAEPCGKHWYAGACDRKTADEALIRCGTDGAFTVRQSSGQDAQQPYTLVVLYHGRVYNIPIRLVPATQHFALGREKSGEEYFSSVSDMIETHQRTPLVLIDGQNNTKDTTMLSHPVRPRGRSADHL